MPHNFMPAVSNSATYINYVDGQSSASPSLATSSSDPLSTLEILRPYLEEVSVEEFFGIDSENPAETAE